MSPTLTRRAAILGAAVSSVALAIPAAAAVRVAEHPNEKVRRLAKEMAEALRDPDFIGFAHVTVTPEHVSYTDGPDQRIFEIAEQWRDAMDAWAGAIKGKDSTCDEPEADMAFALETEMKTLVPQTAKGVCVKMLVLTGYGDFTIPVDQILEAAAVTRFAPYSAHPMTRAIQTIKTLA